jgi:hypothetical protein
MVIKAIILSLGLILAPVSSASGFLLDDNETNLIVAFDYDFEQDCSESSVCFGFIDFMKSFEYDISEGIIRVETYMPTNCSRDGILRDRFQFIVRVELNGTMVGTLKRMEYDLSNGIIWIDTNELNFNC